MKKAENQDTLLKHIKADVIEKWEKAIPEVSRFVCALYHPSEDGQFPIQFGSGFLLNVGSRFFLVTAAHVLDENDDDKTLYIAAPESGNLEELAGPSFRTDFGGNRQKDQQDVGVIEITGSLLDNIGKLNFASVDQLDVNDTGEHGSLYFATGYPATKNKVKRSPSRAFRRRLFNYLANILPSDKLTKLNLSPASHLIISFDKKNTFLPKEDSKTTPPDPHGVSGGPLLRFDAYGEGALKCMIVGMVIEYHESLRGILAVRAPFFVEALAHHYPDLVPLLPKTKTVNITVTNSVTKK